MTPSAPASPKALAPSSATILAPTPTPTPPPASFSFKAWWKAFSQPLQIMFRLLILMAVLATLSWGDWRLNTDEWITAGAKFGMIVLGAWGAMQALKLAHIKPSVRWEHRFITALILFLLFAPDAPWWGFLVLGAVTETIQRLVRLPSGPVANPAAAGTLVSAVLLGAWGVIPTWWGVSFSPRWYLVPEGLSIGTLVLVPVAVWVAWKYKKLWTVGALLLASTMAYTVVFGLAPTYLLLEGTLLFFALVMAAEPKTSPVLRNEQILFGAGVGILMVLLLKIYFVEAYAGALVLGNVVYNGRRWLRMQNSSLTGGTTPPLRSKG